MRVVIYDATDTSKNPEISDAWRAGARLYRALGRFDRSLGAGSWDAALSWLRGLGKVNEVQFWGHGNPGRAYLGGNALEPLQLEGVDVRDVFWLRTCASFAGVKGQMLAEQMSSALGCRVAGHTHNIGLLQSGLHTLSPTERPYWSVKDGLSKDGKAKGSAPWLPRTVHCLESNLPRGW